MLKSLKIENFRGFQFFELQQLGRINLLVGKNNSGKTSVLESLQLLFCSPTNFEAISQLILNRSEYLWAESIRNEPMLNVQHLFHGHEVDIDTKFRISGVTSRFDEELTVLISEDKEQVSFFDDSLNKITDLYSIFNWKHGGREESLQIPLFPNYGISLDYLRRIRTGIKSSPSKTQMITSSSLRSKNLVELFDQIVLTTDELVVQEALKILDPRIERVASVNELYSLGERGGFIVRLSNSNHRVPIGSLGDGIWRMLSLILAIVNVRGGILLVDEIDTGLHFEVMLKMWKLIWETAKRLNVQVFATTHSRDCWESLAELAESENVAEDEIVIHRIEQNRPRSAMFDAEMAVIAANQGIEVR